MNLLRFLHAECVTCDLDFVPSEPREDETEGQLGKRRDADKERVLLALCHLMEASGQVASVSKLHRDLIHRERKATTGIGSGLAIPHVRTMQARHFIMGLALWRGPEPLWFDSLDGEGVRAFFIMLSPPYEDRLYLQAYKAIGSLFKDEEFAPQLQACDRPNDVFNLLRGILDR